jgi:hypothetical protein
MREPSISREDSWEPILCCEDSTDFGLSSVHAQGDLGFVNMVPKLFVELLKCSVIAFVLCILTSRYAGLECLQSDNLLGSSFLQLSLLQRSHLLVPLWHAFMRHVLFASSDQIFHSFHCLRRRAGAGTGAGTG